MKTAPYIQTIDCVLTQEELAMRAKEQAKQQQELRKQEEHGRETRAELGQEEKKIKAKLDHLAEVVRSGTEQRPVECQDQIGEDRHTVITFRCDTGEEVGSRPMTENERAAAMQGDIFAYSQAVQEAAGKGRDEVPSEPTDVDDHQETITPFPEQHDLSPTAEDFENWERNSNE